MIQGINGIDEYIDDSDTNLTSVTYIDTSISCLRNPVHLVRLSCLCPNLQRLDLSGNVGCLKDLEGLRSLAKNCRNLWSLNLKGISKKQVFPPDKSVTVLQDYTYS